MNIKMEPPPVPKKESSAVTIANQAVQIDNLLQRIEDLSNSRNEAVRQRLEFELQADTAKRELEIEQVWHKSSIDRLTESQAKIAKLESQIEGYRMAVKDIHGAGK